MISCPLCQKKFTKKAGLKCHFVSKKNPCIKNKKKWEKEKEKFLPIQPKQITFDKYQKQFIESELDDGKLLGVPGGGKTRCIIEKIEKLYQDKVLNSPKDYLILTFSKRSRFDFLKKGKEISNEYKKDTKNKSTHFSTKNVRTLHSMAGFIVTKISNKNSGCLETVILAALNILEDDEIKIAELEELNKLQVIFVDEAQDISEKQYQFITKLKDKLNCKLILVGDPNQNIYQFQGGSDKFLLEYQAKLYQLKRNYRSTSNIVKFINSISPHETKMISNSRKKSDKISIFQGTIDQIEKDILKELKNSKIDLSDIAIIGPVKRCNIKDGNYLNIGLSLIVNALSKNKINFIKHYTDTNNAKFDNNKIVTKENHVNLFTIHGCKGLEFEKVYLLNYHFTTFGIIPTLADYNIFKYLWYVGVSRAKSKLTIYKAKDKILWPLTQKVDPKILQTNFKPKYKKKLKFNEPRKELGFAVTTYLEDLKPHQLYQYQNLIKFEKEGKKIFTIKKKLLEYNNFSALYGRFIEAVFEFYYYYFQDELPEKNLFSRIIYQLKNTVTIPNEYVKSCKILLKKLNISLNTPVNLETFEIIKYQLDSSEIIFYEYLKTQVKNDDISLLKKNFFLIYENKVIKQHSKKIIRICKKMIKNIKKGKVSDIFEIILYRYQLETESGYLLDTDFTEHLESVEGIIEEIKKFAEKIKDDKLTFQYFSKHPNFPIRGILDIVNLEKKQIIDIKFTKKFHIKHALQLLFYYNNLVPAWDEEYELLIYNFYTGEIYQIKFDKSATNYQFLKLLANTTNTKLSKMLFCYDLETTGLDITSLQITERYFEEYNLKFSPSNGFVKIKGKIPLEIIKITGITDKMVKKGDSLNIFLGEIKDIFKYCDHPKFMAHNGSVFDHKVLFSKLPKCINSKNQLLDSRYIIRMLSKKDTLKLSLSDTYTEVVKKEIINAHRAKDDVDMMVEILKKLNYNNN
jgi:DNA polymerase III epsilon subunit-like protein